MTFKTVFFSLIIITASTFFIYFGQSSNANPVSNTIEQDSQPRKFDPKEIANQFPFKEGSTLPVIELKSHLSTSLPLEGDIHNEYQIRDDILAYIEEATKGNEKARKAAIKFAYYENQAYYHSLTSDEAVGWNRKSNVACWCLVMAEPEKWDPINRKIAELMNNSADRKQHISDADDKFFAWKVLGSGMTEREETATCKSGIY